MGPLAGDLPDAVGDVPQAGSDGASPGVHQVRRDLGRVEEGLDL